MLLVENAIASAARNPSCEDFATALLDGFLEDVGARRGVAVELGIGQGRLVVRNVLASSRCDDHALVDRMLSDLGRHAVAALPRPMVAISKLGPSRSMVARFRREARACDAVGLTLSGGLAIWSLAALVDRRTPRSVVEKEWASAREVVAPLLDAVVRTRSERPISDHLWEIFSGRFAVRVRVVGEGRVGDLVPCDGRALSVQERVAVRLTLQGEGVGAIANALGIDASTASRRLSSALVALGCTRATLPLFSEVVARSWLSWGPKRMPATFTAAEVEIAMALLDGFSSREIAERRRVSPLTIRNQIASMRSKVGAESVEALVKVIVSPRGDA